MKFILILVLIIAALAALIFLGLQFKPASFPPFPQQEGSIDTVALPEGLPGPVERFYRQIYGPNIPVITSAVITGRAELRPAGGITFPGRFRFTHDAGKAYRHYLEASLFTLPLMKVNEHYIDGESRLELPFETVEREPKINQAANLGLWAESIWLPALYLTDLKVRWEPVDEETALLVVPFDDIEEQFVVRFDPDTNLIRFLEAMRYKEADSTKKSLWICEAIQWGTVNGRIVPTVASLTWFGDKQPWAIFTVDEVVYNVDVGEYLRKKGI